MPVSPYIRKIRESIDQDLLLLPSVAVLPRDRTAYVSIVYEARVVAVRAWQHQASTVLPWQHQASTVPCG